MSINLLPFVDNQKDTTSHVQPECIRMVCLMIANQLQHFTFYALLSYSLNNPMIDEGRVFIIQTTLV